MPVECYDALTKFAVNRFFWHRKKCKEIKADIDNRTYGPTKIVSDWLDCWCTTVDDWCTAMRMAHGQVATIVFRLKPSFQGRETRRLPALVVPGAELHFTEVSLTEANARLQQPRPLTRDDFSATPDPTSDGTNVVVTVSPGAALIQGTYQTLLYAEDLDGPTPLAMVIVDVRA